jgi:hypothetical protein
VCRSGGQGGTQPPGYTCRIRRVTTQDESYGSGPELGDMNAVIMVGRPSWRREYSVSASSAIPGNRAANGRSRRDTCRSAWPTRRSLFGSFPIKVGSKLCHFATACARRFAPRWLPNDERNNENIFVTCAPSRIRTCGLLLRRSSQAVRQPARTQVGSRVSLSESDRYSPWFTAPSGTRRAQASSSRTSGSAGQHGRFRSRRARV